MSNERTLMKVVRALSSRKGRPLGHFQQDCLALVKHSGPKSVDELMAGDPPAPTDFLTRCNTEYVKMFGRHCHRRQKPRRDIGKSHARVHKLIGGKKIPKFSMTFMRKSQHSALATLTDHMLALPPDVKKDEATLFNRPLKTLKRKLSHTELTAEQLSGIAGLKKRRAHLHDEEAARVNGIANPYMAEHQKLCADSQSGNAKLQAARNAAKVSAEQEKHVFRMNSDHAPLVRGMRDNLPLHYTLVSSIWDAEIILVSDLAVVTTWLHKAEDRCLPRTVLLGRSLGCRFAVEQYLRASKAHWEHPMPLSIKFKPAIVKPAGIFMTEAFQTKHKSTTSFIEKLVTLQISKWKLLDADQRARWETDKRSKLVTVLDSSTDFHNLVDKLSVVDLHGSSSTPFTRNMISSDGAFLFDPFMVVKKCFSRP
jgi:hypothetical protein